MCLEYFSIMWWHEVNRSCIYCRVIQVAALFSFHTDCRRQGPIPMFNGVVCCLLQVGRNVRMNSAFSKISWTCANYSQSLKCMPACQRWLFNSPVKRLCAVVGGNARTVSSGSVRALLNHLAARQTQTYSTDKADDKAQDGKESSSPPGLLRRFHQTYKEHGKILVCVHLATSAVWASIFYCAALRLLPALTATAAANILWIISKVAVPVTLALINYACCLIHNHNHNNHKCCSAVSAAVRLIVHYSV